jgi:hypothetical protein
LAATAVALPPVEAISASRRAMVAFETSKDTGFEPT